MLEENNSRKVFLSVLGVAILLVAVVGVSFAAFTYTSDAANQGLNSITTGTITMSYAEPTNGITITDALPMTETTAMALYQKDNATEENETNGVFTFTVKATASGTVTVPYEINITKEDGSTLADSAVRINLTTGTIGNETKITKEGGILMSELKNTAATFRTGAYTLKRYDVAFTNGTTTDPAANQTYHLRMWVDDKADATVVANQTYRIKVHVDSQVKPIGTAA